MITLQGKTAVVTGAARGLGKAIAQKLASLGARVVIADVDEAGACRTAEECMASGGEAAVYACNVAHSDSARQLIQFAVDTYERIDIIVNNAGITRDAMLHKMEGSQWEDVIQVNLSGVFHCMQPAAAVMREQRGGRIINISSISWQGNVGQANYAAAKAGVIGLTKTAAKELAGLGITCNAVCPGFMDTDMTKSIPEPAKERMIGAIPLKRIGQPEDVAAVVAFLASDAASYITGEVIHVSGGLQL